MHGIETQGLQPDVPDRRLTQIDCDINALRRCEKQFPDFQRRFKQCAIGAQQGKR